MVLSCVLIFYVSVVAAGDLSAAAVTVNDAGTGAMIFSGSVWDFLLSGSFPDLSNKTIKRYSYTAAGGLLLSV